MSGDEYFVDEVESILRLASGNGLGFGCRMEGEELVFYIENSEKEEFSLKIPGKPEMVKDYDNVEDILSTMGILMFKMEYDKLQATRILGEKLLFELIELGEKINYIAKGSAIT
ncbi:MAG: hypothetical protein OEY59_02210 [Deltaproteobacteria bacterium]|nr:hypothetical protein [Deltaproteobacteria bacterium]